MLTHTRRSSGSTSSVQPGPQSLDTDGAEMEVKEAKVA